MTTSLDSILSPGGEAVPQADETTKPVETTQPADAGGKGTEPPAEVGQTDEPSEESADGQKTVPHAALHAEKQKVKRYTEEVVDLRKSNETLQRQINEVLQRIPVPQQATVEKPDFFVDPDAAVQQHLSPVLQYLKQQQETQSRRWALKEHGREKVDAAYQSLASRMRSDPKVAAEYQRIMQSDDQWEELVNWHDRDRLEQSVALIGSDSTTHREKMQRVTEFAADPDAYEAKLLAKLQSGNGQAAQQPLVLPSNLATTRSVGGRAPPAWAGPIPLADIFNRTKPAA